MRAVRKENLKDVAIKSITKEKLASLPSDAQSAIRWTLEVHSRLHHEHLLGLTSSFEDAKCFYIVTELAEEGTLRDLIDELHEDENELSEDEAFYYFI